MRSRGLNPHFRPVGAIRGIEEVAFPPRMDLQDNRDVTVHLLRALQQAILESDSLRVVLRMDTLNSISEAAAVMLVAEIERCILYSPDRKEVSGRVPAYESEAYTVLQGLRAFDFLNIPSRTKLLPPAHKDWFNIFSGRETDGDRLGELQDYFHPFVKQFFPENDSKWDRQFYKAMLDAASNTLEHAYDPPGRSPWIIGRWWAAGIVNALERSICFVFWDQGLGIPRTMRRKVVDILQHDDGLIERAIQEGYSRYRGNARRGHGLSELLDLLLVSPSGEFEIHSGLATHVRRKAGEAFSQRHTLDIQGTMLVWTVRRART